MTNFSRQNSVLNGQNMPDEDVFVDEVDRSFVRGAQFAKEPNALISVLLNNVEETNLRAFEAAFFSEGEGTEQSLNKEAEKLDEVCKDDEEGSGFDSLWTSLINYVVAQGRVGSREISLANFFVGLNAGLSLADFSRIREDGKWLDNNFLKKEANTQLYGLMCGLSHVQMEPVASSHCKQFAVAWLGSDIGFVGLRSSRLLSDRLRWLAHKLEDNLSEYGSLLRMIDNDHSKPELSSADYELVGKCFDNVGDSFGHFHPAINPASSSVAPKRLPLYLKRRSRHLQIFGDALNNGGREHFDFGAELGAVGRYGSFGEPESINKYAPPWFVILNNLFSPKHEREGGNQFQAALSLNCYDARFGQLDPLVVSPISNPLLTRRIISMVHGASNSAHNMMLAGVNYDEILRHAIRTCMEVGMLKVMPCGRGLVSATHGERTRYICESSWSRLACENENENNECIGQEEEAPEVDVDKQKCVNGIMAGIFGHPTDLGGEEICDDHERAKTSTTPSKAIGGLDMSVLKEDYLRKLIEQLYGGA